MAVDRYKMADVLYELVTGLKVPVECAWSRKIDDKPIMKSFIVEGLGEISVPVSEQVLMEDANYVHPS